MLWLSPTTTGSRFVLGENGKGPTLQVAADRVAHSCGGALKRHPSHSPTRPQGPADRAEPLPRAASTLSSRFGPAHHAARKQRGYGFALVTNAGRQAIGAISHSTPQSDGSHLKEKPRGRVVTSSSALPAAWPAVGRMHKPGTNSLRTARRESSRRGCRCHWRAGPPRPSWSSGEAWTTPSAAQSQRVTAYVASAARRRPSRALGWMRRPARQARIMTAMRVRVRPPSS
jgi:hypothetical protein